MLFYPNEYKVYSPKVEPLLVKVTWFHRKKKSKKQKKPECVSRGTEGKCEERAVGLGSFSFDRPVKMCEWKLGVDFMSKYGILPPNSFLQS